MKITWYGHATFSIETNGKKILIDPFFKDNPATDVHPSDVKADYILITHGHGDHYGDTTAIAKASDALVISNFEIVNFATQVEGCPNGHPLHIGGSHEFPFGRVKLTIAHHGSSLPDGSYGGNPAGLLLTIEGKKIYHAGDTGLFYDMKLIGEEGLDLAILPIGDNFTMGPDDALRAVKLLQPKQVLPIHYNTWDLIAQDVDDWKRRVESETSTQVLQLAPNNSFDF